ncbi:MAG: rRNA maturation RNase YbeY [Chitinophagaceae bacterium]|nr:rRNA maturation RNase YbeY [Chitinophagaceae bacterium]
MAEIRFFFEYTPVSLADRKKLKGFLEQIFRKEKKKLHSLHYIFCSDEYLLQINKDFLNHHYYTDIITFELSTVPASIQGEIYISVERVKENAAHMQTSFKNELHRVIFHGALHLCGYNDKLKEEIITMRKKEDRLLDLYFNK